MSKYELTLRIEKMRTYAVIGWILFGIQVVAFLAMAFFFEEKKIQDAAKTGLLIIVIVSAIMVSLRKTKYSFGLSSLLFCCGIVWVSAGYYVIAGIAGLISLLHSMSTIKKIVRINTHYILYPALGAYEIPWKNISTCLLKDGLLTIDLKNNKLMQHLVDEKTNIDEKEFNEFCREQLNKVH